MDNKKTVGSEKTVPEKTVSEETVRISPRTGKPIEKKFAPKNKRKPRGGNSPVIGMNGYDLEAGDNTKYLSLNMELFNMSDIDLNDVGEVENRLNDFFALYVKYDMKPTVAGMAMALGMNRRTLIAIVNDYATGGTGYKSALPPDVTLSIKKAYNLMENLWENYMNSGKLNPVTGIFLAKNNYGYQDKTEYVLTPNQHSDNDYSADEIRERYIAADQQKRLSDSGSDDDSSND